MAPGTPGVLEMLLALDQTAGRIAESKQRIDRAAQASPESSEIAELQARVAVAEEDFDAAKASLRRATDLDPRNLTAHLGLADLELRDGDIAGMIGVLERAVVSLPESSELQFRLALVYEREGEQAKAIAAYEAAVALDDDLGQAKNNLAYLLAETPGGDLDRALELAQQAKEQLPDDGNAADTLGWVLLKRGVPSAAIGYLEEAAERFPADSFEVQGIVRNHLAEAYEKNSEAAKAVEASERSVESYQKLAASAKERGVDFAEPDWAQQARARIERLGTAG
jgi:tetratricopeptide (TPR) repeat protein